MKELYYNVAEHIFLLTIPKDFTTECLANYTPFHTDKTENLLFHLTIGDREDTSGKLIGNFSNDTATIIVYSSNSGGYIFHIAPPEVKHCCIMETTADYRCAHISLKGDTRYFSFALDNCLMLLYAFTSAPCNTVMIHASVIKHKERGYLFLGKSGTGKSTHSRLWLEHISDSELLNDDNPVVRIIDDRVMVYGSPWSGKTPCYQNRKVEIGAFVRIQQKPNNSITLNSLSQSFALLKPSCSTAPWDKEVHNGICDTLTIIAQKTNTYTLGCRPDREAAELCNRTVTK